MKNAIPYQGGFLMPGSTAYKLFTEGKMKELQIHMYEVNRKYHELRGDK